jgi:hypothetical protein
VNDEDELMAGRIRTIKPELIEDESTAGLSHEAFRLFVGLILLADDYGNFRAHPKQLEGQIFWLAGVKEGVESVLDELLKANLIMPYQVREQRYAHVAGWEKHQRIDKPGKPRCPGPNDSREIRETLATDLRPPTSDHDPDQEATPEAAPPAEPVGPALVPDSAKEQAEHVREVFAYWAEKSAKLNKCPPGKYRLTNERRNKVKGRLADGYSVADLKLAIDGCFKLDHNTTGGYTDLELICRNASKADRFIASARGTVSNPQPANANSWAGKGSRIDHQPYHQPARLARQPTRQEGIVAPAMTSDFLEKLGAMRPPEVLSGDIAHVDESTG